MHPTVNTLDGFKIDIIVFLFFICFSTWKQWLFFFLKTLNIVIVAFFFIRNDLLCTSSSICSPVAAVLCCVSNVFAGLALELCITLPCRSLCRGCDWVNTLFLTRGSASWKCKVVRKRSKSQSSLICAVEKLINI